MTRSLLLGLALFGALLLSPAIADAQTINDYREFYRLLRINATEQVVPCYPSAKPLDEPIVYGVDRDTAGRPTRITRFTFGNPDTRGEWTTMRIAYTPVETNNTIVQRRTFYGASGVPLTTLTGFAVEIIYRRNGGILMRKYVDADGKPVNDLVGTSWTLYLPVGEAISQEWYFSNRKLHFGTGSDGPYHPFAAMPEQTYYRKMVVNAAGELVREEVRGFDKKSLPYPNGEFAHAYELNACGQPTRIIFLDTGGNPMADSDGVATRTFEYDTNGRMIAWSAFDLKGNPKGRRGDGVAVTRKIYREFDGILVDEQWFDAKGNQLPGDGLGSTNR
ncbi:MAG: hypothetical protein JWQ98_2772 [Chlorobi bacterium]|nr:hypothetical protein [Chlorobiota bacterium]